jgi:hypothetical protein
VTQAADPAATTAAPATSRRRRRVEAASNTAPSKSPASTRGAFRASNVSRNTGIGVPARAAARPSKTVRPSACEHRSPEPSRDEARGDTRTEASHTEGCARKLASPRLLGAAFSPLPCAGRSFLLLSTGTVRTQATDRPTQGADREGPDREGTGDRAARLRTVCRMTRRSGGCGSGWPAGIGRVRSPCDVIAGRLGRRLRRW